MFQTKVSDKIITSILYPITFFSENRVVYKILWRNVLQPDRTQMTNNTQELRELHAE